MELTMTQTNAAAETVKAFIQSQVTGTEDWKQLMAEDVVFIAPGMYVEGREANIRLNEEFYAMVTSHQTLQTAAAGKAVFLETVFVITAPSGKELNMPMAEIYEVEKGKIKSMKVYYDPAEFRKEVLGVNNKEGAYYTTLLNLIPFSCKEKQGVPLLVGEGFRVRFY